MPTSSPPSGLASTLQKIGVKAAIMVLVLFPLSLVLFLYERALIPLYGSGPTSFLLNKILLVVFLLSAAQPFAVSLSRNRLYAALALTLAPNATYWVAVWTSRLQDPLLGPATTHAAVIAPLTFIFETFIIEMDSVSDLDNNLDILDTYKLSKSKGQGKISSNRAPLNLRLTRAVVSYMITVGLANKFWTRTSFFNSSSESDILLGLAGILFALFILMYPSTPATLSTSEKTKKTKVPSPAPSSVKLSRTAAFIAFWWSIYPYFANPVLPHPLMEPYSHPSYPLRILSAVQSVSGLIVVGEALEAPLDKSSESDMFSVRYMRASHSILGGVWMGDRVQHLGVESHPLVDSFGTPLGDSIYATFVLQEAARLINSTATGKAESWKDALIIGLGTGISATALSKHGIATTIVEIDPAVYNASRTFFGLPDPGPGRVFLEDARLWTFNKRASIEAKRESASFDFVVHDCFSGGGVPQHIFTVEFWEDLKVTMRPDAILVVNFAGIVKSDSSRMVVHTLQKSFSQCRAFHDMFDDITGDKHSTDFINIVIFCTQSPSPITFREPRRSDYLGSPLRRHILGSLAKREVNLDFIKTPPEQSNYYLLTDANNHLGALQEEQGTHHWQVMRTVLPDIHWETF